ncbi:S8 family serine peptidase [Streptomyces sp. MUM 203J]|uniref:S8 family serine peptidase n=1 Tax=Streptomyces sp. MUM 203J TaxID=2791990 RepID=UPI0035ABD95A
MTPEPPNPIPGMRRAARVAAAAGLVAALVAAGAAPVLAAPAAAPAPEATPNAPEPGKSAEEKLGSEDAERLAEAEARGEKTVTLMVATEPGKTDQVARELDAVKGGTVGQRHDKLGYVRATVPTSQAEAAIGKAAKLSSVQGIDLKHEIVLEDPRPDGGRGGKAPSGSAGSGYLYPAPTKRTPAANPYNPSHETGAVDFVRKNPGADGRGVTIGILDSGVDLGHPALQKTTTGERKIVDWVTATDPVSDGDGTWLRMDTPVSGSTFTAAGKTWTAPEGSYRFRTFAEAATEGGDMAGDLNRDGDTTDVWGVLYDEAAGTVRVDLDGDFDFSDDEPMKPYKDGFQVGYFGTDNPKTDVVERIPFVVEIRKDVVFNGAGDKADFVSIGVIEGSHGTHVAGITAAHRLFGGKMNGAAPGAKLVSSRACTWSGGCTNVALTEGMIDLVVNRGVDIVNMSIGGLPALNDGNNARARLYTRLIDEYGVQLVVSAGNSGPGVNTIGDPALADKVISVGAAISKETWAANYGSAVEKKYQMLPFSSRGPREDGGFTPTLTAPGAAVNTTQTWSPGDPVKEAGYQLPAGYSMLQGTSMSAPQATGAMALMLSAAKQKGIDLTPAKLRTAVISQADHIPDTQAHEQGAGRINVVDAWKEVLRGADAHEYTVKAPVDTAIDQFLKEPGFGTGLYDREGGIKVGQEKVYEVTVTRTTGADKPIRHELWFENNHEDTFRIVGSDEIVLPLNKPVTFKVAAKPRSAGVHSAALELSDPKTKGIDRLIQTTVVASEELAEPSFSHSASSIVQRNETRSYFVTVPAGAKALEIAMSGLAKDSQTRFIAIHPYGVPADPTSTIYCYPNYESPKNTCRPDLRSYPNPQPGVWEIEVEARRTSPLLDNPYTLDVSVLGVTFDPQTQTLESAAQGSGTPVEWQVTNGFAALEGRPQGGSLGSAKVDRPTIGHQGQKKTTVEIGEGVERFDVAIGNVSDKGADLDLTVLRDGVRVGFSADADSEESVSLLKPAPGTYTIVVDGYAVPAGETAYDYKDVFFSSSLGEIKVDRTNTLALKNGESGVFRGEVVVNGPAPEGRQFFGEVSLLNARGTAAGTGSVVIKSVTQ